MKISKRQLKRIIREEKARLIRESRSRRHRQPRRFRMTEGQLRGLVRHAILNEASVWDTIKRGAQQVVDLPGSAVRAAARGVKSAGDVVTQGVEDAGDYWSEKAEKVVPLRTAHEAGQAVKDVQAAAPRALHKGVEYVKDVVADPHSLERAAYKGGQLVKDTVAQGKKIAEPIAQDWWDILEPSAPPAEFGLFEDDLYEDELGEAPIDRWKSDPTMTQLDYQGQDPTASSHYKPPTAEKPGSDTTKKPDVTIRTKTGLEKLGLGFKPGA